MANYSTEEADLRIAERRRLSGRVILFTEDMPCISWMLLLVVIDSLILWQFRSPPPPGGGSFSAMGLPSLVLAVGFASLWGL